MAVAGTDPELVRSTQSSGWFVLYTRYQHEKLVAESLTYKGFEVFLPLYTSLRLWKDRKRELRLPLFPCYVFLWGGLERKLDVLTTPGVCFFVAVNGQPATVPSQEIESIRRAASTTQGMKPYPFLRHGDRVRVTRGPFEGIEGILTCNKNVYRLVLSVEMLGQSAAVEIDRSMVEPVPSPAARTVSHAPTRKAPASSSSALDCPNRRVAAG